MDMETRITQLVVSPKRQPTFSEAATIISIDDEAGGEFVVVKQSRDNGGGQIAFDPEEWPAIREAINRLIKECRDA